MQQESALDYKISWFVNPWFDIILLAGFPTFIVITFLVYFFHSHLTQQLAYNYLYIPFNFPHVISGLSIIYLYPKEWKKKTITFLLIPLTFISFVIVLLFILNYKQLTLFRSGFSAIHLFFQEYFILQLYKLKNSDYLKTDKTIDTLFLIVLSSDYLLRGEQLAMRGYSVLKALKLDVLSKVGSFLIQNYWQHLVAFIVIVFILRQVYLFLVYKKIYFFKIALFLSFFLSYHFLLLITRDYYISYMNLIQWHNIRWVSWVWFYHLQRHKKVGSEAAWFISYILKWRGAIWFFFSLVSVSLLFNLLIFRIPFYNKIIYMPLSLLHFFIEIPIWKASKMRAVVI